MNGYKLAAVVAALAFLAVSVYAPRPYRSASLGTSKGSMIAEPPVQEETSVSYKSGVEISVGSVGTDKDLYHSAETMNITADIYCSDDIEGVNVTARGIAGKMSLGKTVNMTAGGNEITFEYRLPRCNVCGGIRAGTHSCTVEASYGDVSSQNSTSVEIRQ